MSDAQALPPTTNHQKILGRMHTQIANQLLDKPCQPFIVPVDVKLPVTSINSAG